jgi:pimeloyl-ACP methyl ester carboxylesterase
VITTALALVLAAATPAAPAALPLKSCVVQGVPARCGTLAVPENRDTGFGAKIGLRVVVLPSRRTPALPDAFTYLAGGPGSAAASDMTAAVTSIWSRVRDRHDVLLVDQRGTGGSHPLECKELEDTDDVGAIVGACLSTLNGDMTQYGTAAAADDLEAVRAALGYRRLNLYGISYGATLAQVYLARHPRSVRTVALDGATLLDIPFYGKFAANSQRALDQLGARCEADAGCRRAFPTWRSQLASLIAAWNETPKRVTSTVTLGGDGLAGVIHSLTLNAASAATIPLVVSRAARGDYERLARSLATETETPVMYWSIWCNERWVGLDAAGPWGTYLDGYVAGQVAFSRSVCAFVPDHEEPASNQARVRSQVPVLALVGGADPQDPIGNIAGLSAAMPKSRTIVVPAHGHGVGHFGCLPDLVARFIERGGAARLDARCVRKIKPPPFVLR